MASSKKQVAGILVLLMVLFSPDGEATGFDKGGFQTIEEALSHADLQKYVSPANDQVIFRAANNTKALEAELGSYFAGTWIDYDEENVAHQFVATTSVGVSSKTLRENPDILVVNVKYGLKVMEAAYKRILFEFIVNKSAPVVITSATIDVQKNMIAVRVNTATEIDKARSELAKAGFDMDMLYFEVGRAPRPA